MYLRYHDYILVIQVIHKHIFYSTKRIYHRKATFPLKPRINLLTASLKSLFFNVLIPVNKERGAAGTGFSWARATVFLQTDCSRTPNKAATEEQHGCFFLICSQYGGVTYGPRRIRWSFAPVKLKTKRKIKG